MISSCVHVTLCFAVLDHWLLVWLVGQLVGLLPYGSEQPEIGASNLHSPTNLGASE